MYLDYFGLKEFPFSLVSDPRFLYLSQDHRRVRAYIEYAMKIQDSFVVCTGEIGTGKTTLINDALTRRGPQSVIIRIQASNLNAEEFMQTVLVECGIEPYSFSKVQMMDKLKQFLLAQNRSGKKAFLFVDEAQNLDKSTLEDIRYLSDIEVDQKKLLSILLVGQPELNETLDQPDMEHLLQRIRLRFHIKALGIEDVSKYIKHRIAIAGLEKSKLFDESCLPMIHEYTGGRLRLINTLCDYALMYCCVEKLPMVTEWVIQKAVNELQWESYEKRFGQKSDVTKFKINIPAETEFTPATLILRRGSEKVAEYKLEKECLNIGRHMENDITVDDHKVSRNHAKVIVQGGHAYLHDLTSTNGTYVKQNKVNLHQLADGDEFSIGDFTFSYVDESQVMVDVERNGTEQWPLEKEQTRIRKIRPSLSLVDN